MRFFIASLLACLILSAATSESEAARRIFFRRSCASCNMAAAAVAVQATPVQKASPVQKEAAVQKATQKSVHVEAGREVVVQRRRVRLIWWRR